MKLGRVAFACAVATSLLSLTGGRPAAAQPGPVIAPTDHDGERRRLYAEGKDLFKSGNYPGARQKWEAAYALGQRFGILYSLALVYQNLRLPRPALDALEKYIDEAGVCLRTPGCEEAKTAEKTKQLEALLADAQSLVEPLRNEFQIGSFSIRELPKNTTVWLDDQPLHAPPIEPKRKQIAQGRHSVEAVVGGTPAAREDFTLGAKHLTIAFDFQKMPKPLPPPAPPPPPPVRDPPLLVREVHFGVKEWSYVGMGAGAAGAGAGVMVLIGGHNKTDDARERRDRAGTPEDRAAAQADYEIGKGRQRLGLWITGIGGAIFAGSAALFAVDRALASGQRQVLVSGIIPTGNGMVMHGRF